MQVFKTFFRILKKKVSVAAIYVIVFLALAVPLSRSDHNDTVFEQTKLKLCLFDEDNSEESRALSDFLKENHRIVELQNDPDVIMDALYYERVDLVLTIEKGYGEKLGKGETEGLFSNRYMHDSYAVVYARQLLNRYVKAANAYMAGGYPAWEAAQLAGKAVLQEVPVDFVDMEGDQGIPDFPKNFSRYFQYLPYILISAIINTLCPVLLSLNRKEIRFRTGCSSIRPADYTTQIFAGSAVLVAGIWLLFAGMGMFMYGGVYRGIAWLAVLNSFLFALVSAAAAVLIASFSPGKNLVNLITQIVGLGMSFLCGIFVDQSLLGEGVLKAARFLPAYWYVRGNRMLSGVESYDGAMLAKFFAIEGAFAGVLMILTLLVYKARQRES